MEAKAAELKAIFKRHDHDGSGVISLESLQVLLQKIGGLKAENVECMLQTMGLSSASLIDYSSFIDKLVLGAPMRSRSLPKRVREAGGINMWNAQSATVTALSRQLGGMCNACTVNDALVEVRAIMSMGTEHNLWAYAYMRKLYDRLPDVFYGTLLAAPAELLPAVYTPVVGEACQKFGCMPMYNRGCYLSVEDKGKFKEVLWEYALAELELDAAGKPLCDCIVFSDGGRILGLGDLGTWGMGIPIGKLDLYTVCAGVNPRRTIPLIIDAGCYGPEGNTDKLVIRDHACYTGSPSPRVTSKSEAGTVINSMYFGPDNVISEFMQAATELFGFGCLLQFEDFNSNDAFPLLAEYRDKFVTYNDDIQGTASVAVAALLGAIRLRGAKGDLRAALREQCFFFHGAGSANIGLMRLLRDEAGVPASQLYVTNSRGLIWCGPDGKGNFRNFDQREFGQPEEPQYNSKDLPTLVKNVKPTVVIGAVGVSPGCFTKPMIEALVHENTERPVVFALSNPKSQAEITASDAYNWSMGRVIYGSGTWFPPVQFDDKVFKPGQVNNVYIFPGVSLGAIVCQAKTIPESFFMAAAEAVANTLSAEELAMDSILPARERIREVGRNVAVAVILDAQRLGIARRPVAGDVQAAVDASMWAPAC